MIKRITTGPTDRETLLIRRLSQIIPSITHREEKGDLLIGIGDDAAVFRPLVSSEWVISTDFSIEGTHFQANYPPDSIGYKSLARATSDLVAMGAKPRYFLLALALPPSKTSKWLRQLASGMSRAAREFDSRLIGGDISHSNSVTICVTVLGESPAGLAIPRSGAKPGDLIYVTGTLGAAQLGLEITLGGLSRRPSLKKCLKPHLYPKIPVALGQALARRHIPSAIMDISDGLSTDLAHLCTASGVGARIRTQSLPAVRLSAALRSQGLDPLALALHGGEDYGLLFTVPPKSVSRLRGVARGTRITHIGEITCERQVVVTDRDNRTVPLQVKGWSAFA